MFSSKLKAAEERTASILAALNGAGFTFASAADVTAEALSAQVSKEAADQVAALRAEIGDVDAKIATAVSEATQAANAAAAAKIAAVIPGVDLAAEDFAAQAKAALDQQAAKQAAAQLSKAGVPPVAIDPALASGDKRPDAVARISRSEFNAMTNFEKSKFSVSGGRITD
jgi:microcystin degradation protein MlrC